MEQKSGKPIIRIISRSQPEAEDRYLRIRQLGWDRDLLRSASALVVGAGTLGNEVLKNLALLGWGNILLVDMDNIESSNLTRSVLFRQSDVGTDSYKAVVAARRVQEINPEVNIQAVVGTVQDMVGLGVFRRMDIVFGCLDNQQARLDVSRACWSTATPFIDAGLDGINGDIRTYLPPYTPCYGCNMSAQERRSAREQNPCLKVKYSGPKPVIPTAPTVSSMMAGWQVQLAVKHLHNQPIPYGERIAIYGMPDHVDRYRLQANLLCLDHPQVENISEDNIIELPFDAAKVTLQDLLSILRDDLEMGPETVIKLDFDILVAGTCRQCQFRKTFFRRLTSVYDREIMCPGCGQPLSLEKQYLFDGSEPYASYRLSELGVPPLHIFLAMNPQRNLYQFVELSGDFADFFQNISVHNPKVLPIEMQLTGRRPFTEYLPQHIPLRLILAQYADDWGIDRTSYWRLRNSSQAFNYDPDDTLTKRGTRPGDTLEVVADQQQPAAKVIRISSSKSKGV